MPSKELSGSESWDPEEPEHGPIHGPLDMGELDVVRAGLPVTTLKELIC